MAKFDIKLTPQSQKVVEALAKVSAIDLRPSLNVIGIGYRKEVEMIFNHQQARNEGMRWAPLSEKYAVWKQRYFPGAPILVRSGALKASMTTLGAPDNISIISKTGAVFGTSIRYGIYHDEGGKVLPKRNFSTPSERRMEIWVEQISRDIARNFERAGISVKEGIIAE